ncbi:hypothetical protein CAPTEDRAFT_188063 [Capitella teleta]|uniref:Integrase catalytic domain-containing protein n=1 Tax=Capitella teleta TaxID=283909 RepID=R7UUI4_CAPTE|nr:hypothetical protein CAPTEDRAFT_188063 [Capitella teleta]|eukprot:ELU07557.1 hypothetical protein CAPTEDRAFT_188063 [Capitella teleta]
MPTETKNAKLSRLYRDPKEAGALRGVSGLQQISKNNHLGVLKREDAKRILKDERSYTLHGRVVNGAQNLTERIASSWPFDMWEADLMERHTPHFKWHREVPAQTPVPNSSTLTLTAWCTNPWVLITTAPKKEPGVSVVERFNQTLGRAIAKYITANPKTTQGHLRQLLPHFVQSYNSTRHSSVRQTPTELHHNAFQKGEKEWHRITLRNSPRCRAHT